MLFFSNHVDFTFPIFDETKLPITVFVFKAVDPAVKGLDLMNLEWFVFENRKE